MLCDASCDLETQHTGPVLCRPTIGRGKRAKIILICPLWRWKRNILDRSARKAIALR
eukprot:CAMPEP_0183392256 /NCGR_PEP_ID=MMETSP0370-20130417/7009_1 /TAXON_ID=268820 /ORGANISM="Peridinium aciculiferum, Strain PAER-2" /LENGTH=56 /DNA_ID=CAMNT_0025572139 /DNA_START=1 /DNA_END=167 /DNA_ORIENTATION=+